MEVGLAVGGAVLSSALNVLFDRMTPKFPNLFRGRKHDAEVLRKLKRKLIVIEAVLDDAEEKQTTNIHVNKWLSEVKDVVYHAEDLTCEMDAEASRLEDEGGKQSVTNTVSHLSDEFLKEMIPKIQNVVDELEGLTVDIDVLGLKRDVMKKDNSRRLPSTSSVDESDVYGRDDERDELIKLVLSDDAHGNKVSVIPVVGMGGIGKTTLTQVVYGNEEVKKYFDKRAWVCVSHNYDTIKIIKTLVEEVTSSNSEGKDNLNMLEDNLKESLAKKKFLIVLDDVWNENPNDWDKLMVIFKSGKQGSKIIVTTRNEDVARMMAQQFQLLEPISDDGCWSLFKKHALGNGGSLTSPEFEKIGKEIVKKCKGLPLAVKTLGGLLRSKTKVNEWDYILRSEFWKLNDVLPALRLSYIHLPPHLKHCFAFCALFPKNHHFNKEELVFLWMANDLLQHPTQNDKTIEDVGREYFRELKSRCFFQKVNRDKYSMHDLVNDLAKSVSGKFCVRYEDYPHGKAPSEARHLSYMSQYYDAYEKFKGLAQLKSLRTFFPISSTGWRHCKLTKMVLLDILPTLWCLRVLSLCHYDIKELPESICNLKQLRYLNLSATYINQLPDSICGLHNLQILLLSQCRYLDKLPMELTKVVNLCHLDLRETNLKEMPSHISRLKNLRTLSYFIVGNSPDRSIEELQKLHLHGYFKIMGLQNVNSCKNLNLWNKNHLEDLVLQWKGDTNDSHIARDILDKLQPHTNLKSLTIDGYDGTRFSNWLADNSFRNIKSMVLTNCKNCFSLPALGHLASIKFIVVSKLHSIRMVDKEFYGDGSLIKPFKSLVTLRIEQMSELEEWEIPGYVDFSHLEELYIKDCPKLIGKLPSQLLCLKTLDISKCPQLVFPANWMSISEENQVGLCTHLPSLQVLRISDMPNLEELPEWLLRLRLEELKIQNCQSLVPSPKVTTHINKMILEDCASLVSLPIVGLSANIKELNIENCPKIEFPTCENSDSWCISIENLRVKNAGDSFNDISLGLFPKLLTLQLYECGNLKIFPASRGIQNLTLLHRLMIDKCNNLLSFARGGLQAPNLEYFDVKKCKKLKSLPEQMHYLLPSLRELIISFCPEIEVFPEGGLPSSLEYIHIRSCKKLMRCTRDWGLQRLPALRELAISGDDEYEESFPNELLLSSSLRFLLIRNHKKLKTLNEKALFCLTSLQTLYISSCSQLFSLPDKGLPTSLQTLSISSCPNLVSLPKDGLPTSLKTLRIINCPKVMSLPTFIEIASLFRLEVTNCPMLEPHLERERGKYWPNIAHIPIIVLGDELIS